MLIILPIGTALLLLGGAHIIGQLKFTLLACWGVAAWSHDKVLTSGQETAVGWFILAGFLLDIWFAFKAFHRTTKRAIKMERLEKEFLNTP